MGFWDSNHITLKKEFSMNDTLKNQLSELEKINFKVRGTPNGYTLSYNGNESYMEYYSLMPGISLIFNHIHSKKLPAIDECSDAYNNLLLSINYCSNGICEIYTRDNNYLYISAGNLTISKEMAKNSYNYPSASYEGIEIFITDEVLKTKNSLLDEFKINISSIVDNYLSEDFSFCTESLDVLYPPFAALSELSRLKANDRSLIKLNTLLILRLLTTSFAKLYPSKKNAMTAQQIRIAKAVERIITSDLSKRIPIRELAEQSEVSETSLKNYFKGVFGENISDYLLNLRIEKAKELLISTDLSILEISENVGYENQSKFSAIFKRKTGYTPLAYKKISR